jgi:hypothetical protein
LLNYFLLGLVCRRAIVHAGGKENAKEKPAGDGGLSEKSLSDGYERVQEKCDIRKKSV